LDEKEDDELAEVVVGAICQLEESREVFILFLGSVILPLLDQHEELMLSIK